VFALAAEHGAALAPLLPLLVPLLVPALELQLLPDGQRVSLDDVLCACAAEAVVVLPQAPHVLLPVLVPVLSPALTALMGANAELPPVLLPLLLPVAPTAVNMPPRLLVPVLLALPPALVPALAPLIAPLIVPLLATAVAPLLYASPVLRPIALPHFLHSRKRTSMACLQSALPAPVPGGDGFDRVAMSARAYVPRRVLQLHAAAAPPCCSPLRCVLLFADVSGYSALTRWMAANFEQGAWRVDDCGRARAQSLNPSHLAARHALAGPWATSQVLNTLFGSMVGCVEGAASSCCQPNANVVWCADGWLCARVRRDDVQRTAAMC
jgi:hypothetical protein